MNLVCKAQPVGMGLPANTSAANSTWLLWAAHICSKELADSQQYVVEPIARPCRISCA